MKELRVGLIFFYFLFASNTYAAVDCYGVPDFVKMGEFGSQESYVIVRIKNLDYRLGHHTEESSKIRFSIATAALMGEKEVKLRFFEVATCEAASQGRLIPNSFQLVRG